MAPSPVTVIAPRSVPTSDAVVSNAIQQKSWSLMAGTRNVRVRTPPRWG